jgi:hypothetical protein
MTVIRMQEEDEDEEDEDDDLLDYGSWGVSARRTTMMKNPSVPLIGCPYRSVSDSSTRHYHCQYQQY